MILNRLFMSERDLAQKINTAVKNAFPQIASSTGRMSDNSFESQRAAIGQFITASQASTNIVQMSGGTKRIFCAGYSLTGGSHVATD